MVSPALLHPRGSRGTNTDPGRFCWRWGFGPSGWTVEAGSAPSRLTSTSTWGGRKEEPTPRSLGSSDTIGLPDHLEGQNAALFFPCCSQEGTLASLIPLPGPLRRQQSTPGWPHAEP